MAKKEDEIIKENEEIKKTQKEFDEKKKILEDRMINGLLGYVRDGTFPKSTISNYASNMDCHDIIYNYTDKNIGDYILNYHNEKITQSTTECYEKIKNLSGLDFIDSFIDCTDKLNLFIYTMARVFLYITTNHLKASEDKNNVRIYTQDDISEFSMDIYKKTFFNKLMTKLFDTLNELLIRDERNGNMEHRQKIKAIMKTISSLDLVKPKIHKKSATSFTWLEMAKDHKENREYQDKWYDNFKKETKKYLNNKSDKDIKNSSAPEYVKCQLKYLSEEEERQESYINKAYHNDLRNINYEYLIRRNMNTLVEMDTGINNMFKIKKKDQLSEIFQLFSFVPESLELIQKSFRAYIKERLLALYNDKDFSKDPKKFVPALINLKKEMDEIVQMCFDNHNDFQDAENKEFSLVMSKELYPKQLANYADFCMRNGFKGKSEEEIENTLNDIISIFKNINSKLVFQNETEKKMSDRLIKLSSLSINAEKIFISKLKQESGVTYVSKMQEMINDLEKNKGESEGYKLTKSRGAPGGVKFNVQVISQSAWDVQKTHMEKIEIPKFLKNCIDDFETYYIGRHQQTKLLWCLGLSKMEIQYLYLKNKNISTSTLPQFLALYFLEQNTKLNLQQIAQLLGCNVQKVIYDIRGLIFNPNYNTKGQIDKGVILADIDPKTKEFKPSTEISINMNFSVSHQKFNTLPLPQKKTAAEIKASEIEEAQIIKRYQDNILQATITRIMKSRIGQGTTHVWLVNESAKQIDLFKAQPQQIKENIEKLIEKSIIKRNGPSYEYIA